MSKQNGTWRRVSAIVGVVMALATLVGIGWSCTSGYSDGAVATHAVNPGHDGCVNWQAKTDAKVTKIDEKVVELQLGQEKLHGKINTQTEIMKRVEKLVERR